MVALNILLETIVPAVCLLLVGFLTFPAAKSAFIRCTSRGHKYDHIKSHYEDEDGAATNESQELYSDLLRRVVMLLAVVAGLIIAVVFLLLSLLDRRLRCSTSKTDCHHDDNMIWLGQCFMLPAWLLIVGQACTTFTTVSYIKKFELAVCGGISSLLLAISILVQAILWRFTQLSPSATKLHYAFALSEFIIAIALVGVFFTIDRRPDVFCDGRIVDRQYTSSFLGQITFAWATPLLGRVVSNKKLDYADLPVVANDIRARTLRKSFEDVGERDSMWKIVILSHKKTFLLQWTLQGFQSVANFLPQIALYFTLRLLEARDSGKDTALQLWLLVIALGLSDGAYNWLESYLFYVCYVKLAVPIYEQLSAVVFAKAIKKKDVKGVSKSTEAAPVNGDIVTNDSSGVKDENTIVDEDEDDEAVAQTKQSTINLIGVDGKRIADFATYNCMIFGAMLKIMLAVTFLVFLVGWIPMLSGFAAFVALTPVNWWITSKYTKAQDALMKTRDSKMGVVTEALQGIRQIKFSALENEWHAKIGKIRQRELDTQWQAFRYDTCLMSIWILGPIGLSAISLTVYALMYKQLTASVAFTTISIFEAIEVTLAVVPELVTELSDALISSRRIQEYLVSPNREEALTPGTQIKFKSATIAWPADEQHEQEDTFKLRDLDIEFPIGELSVISGKTGSGKSLLLSTIIGEAEIRAGTVTVPQAPPLSERFDHKANASNWYITEAIAYVSQIPWIENATIRDNILFGLPKHDDRYQNVLHASALEKDLEMLQDGDMTDIGANGINLSGGQKWRISFARALYSRAGILVLDDIFSAVDAHVGKHLFEKALTGDLGKDRTRILVTHHVALCLPRTSYSVLLGNGTVLQAGPTEELRRTGLLKDILAYDIEEQQKEETEAERANSVCLDDGGALQKMLSRQSVRSRRVSNQSDLSPKLTRTASHIPVERQPESSPKKFTEEEKREVGAIKLSVYKEYIYACGGIGWWAFILLIFTIWVSIFLGRSYWVSIWTRAYSTKSEATQFVFQSPAKAFQRLGSEFSAISVEHSLYFYLGIYLAVALGSWLVGTSKYFCIYVASIRASKVLFENLCFSILRAPLRFLDTTPMGRILNRFTADFNMIDSKISNDLAFTLHSGISALAVVVAGVFVSPLILIPSVVLFALCFWYATRYLRGAREVKRLESNAKSPVFEQFGSVLTGISTIRAFGKAEEYMNRMDAKINTHCQAYYHLWLFNRWMGLRVAFVGSIFLVVMGALIVGIPGIDASLAGFAISFSLQLSDAIMWMLRQYSNVELDMNAIERIVEYSTMPIEDQSGVEPPAAWPTKGEVEVDDLVVAYAPDLNPVLRGLTFSVKQNERVGVVGRTGAGKSSLTLALFRFLEARSGSICIDGVDVSKIKLSDLRSRLAIIPQDPVLFSGTIRSNLDAFDQHSDSELRDALARVHLISSASAFPSGSATPLRPSTATGDQTPNSTNKNLFSSLTSKISEGGLNLSQGQRQLLCLARAIVSRPKIMVLDEATSSVDMDTDALIQQSIREEFADSTLIVIAHRLSTIVDFDRILVLGEGKVLEFDSPKALMEKEGGIFRGMVEQSGERRELENIIEGSRSGSRNGSDEAASGDERAGFGI